MQFWSSRSSPSVQFVYNSFVTVVVTQFLSSIVIVTGFVVFVAVFVVVILPLVGDGSEL